MQCHEGTRGDEEASVLLGWSGGGEDGTQSLSSELLRACAGERECKQAGEGRKRRKE